jgi:glycerol-3-phosphate cytidylyltransferase
MIVGYTCGVYDYIHIGHINLLKNAKSLCDVLIVGLSTDECVKYKFKNTIIDYESRKVILESIKYVDTVIPQNDTNKILAWNKLKFNKLFVGDDWYNTQKWNEMETFLKTKNVDVIYFPYTTKCSTTMIKKKLINIRNILILFNLDFTLWPFYTNLLSEYEYQEKLKSLKFSDDITRIFHYLKKNKIEFGFVSRSKYKEKCKNLLQLLNIKLEDHLYHIEWNDNKSKMNHIKNISKKSNKSPEFYVLFDNDQEILDSVENFIGHTKLVDKEKCLQFEDFLEILYKL